MDFFRVEVKKEEKRNGTIITISPDFYTRGFKDLMIRGSRFYAIWDEARNTWSTREDDLIRLVDEELWAKRDELQDQGYTNIIVKDLTHYDTGMWSKFVKMTKEMYDNHIPLDSKIIFANEETTREDYSSKKLSYSLVDGECPAYEELMSTLYVPEERDKLEWAIGAIVSGDSRYIEKFIVLHGESGAGKSTFLRIVEQLFEGYWSVFNAKAIGMSANQFSLESFRSNPLVAIQHDGDLSRIEDNTKLNSIIGHDIMEINEKYKGSYKARSQAFLFMGTNTPVQITNSKSGIIRRLITVSPSGDKIPSDRYYYLTDQIKFELGAIAYHCLKVYEELGKNYYGSYKPFEMMYQTDTFFNFVEAHYFEFKKEEGINLKRAWDMYKVWCEDSLVNYRYQLNKFREELKSYFERFDQITRIGGKQVRSWYSGFLWEKISPDDYEEKEDGEEKDLGRSYSAVNLELDGKRDGIVYSFAGSEQVGTDFRIEDGDKSILDELLKDCQAQYANKKETPYKPWDDVKTVLSDIDTKKLHYVRPPDNHIVVDFDLKDDSGEKSLELNLEAIKKWPLTYAELSKSGKGIHLHYIYDGDPNQLDYVYEENVEIKVFTGKSSLRRMFVLCNNVEIAHISSGLPLKGGKKVVDFDQIKSENHLRNLIVKNLAKGYHGATKPSVDFIYKLLEDANASGLKYDVSDMQGKILAFCSSSTNQSEYCLDLFAKMKFKSEDEEEFVQDDRDESVVDDTAPIVFFDVEVFENLFVVCWKLQGKENPVVKMVQPSASDIEHLMQYRLVGFNNRRYDNHVLYAAYIGYNNAELYKLSQDLIYKEGYNGFREAYNISYTDVWDFSTNKQGLKKWEIDLGIQHRELGIRWDEPVPEDRWQDVADYCANDVMATETVYDNNQGDLKARFILAELAGGTVNNSTNPLTTKLIFGNEKKPKLVYTDLATGKNEDGYPDDIVSFPGYHYKIEKKVNERTGDEKTELHNYYRDEDVGKGGYVYAEPGMYTNVALLDVASMHPNSLILLNAYGEYTKKFAELLQARIYIKHKEYDKARELFDGKLSKYLDSPDQAKALSGALKLAANSQYGLTSASFENPCRDVRNVNNIVALRGALFMVDLKHAVWEQGFKVVHIKTDSIKIPDATQEIIDFVFEFGKKYGYSFEHEQTLEKLCLFNDAVYVGKVGWSMDEEEIGRWTSTGAQMIEPYTFKTLFSKEEITFDDLVQTKSATTALYLDFNENLPEGEHDYKFVGKVGAFLPVLPGIDGGLLMREDKKERNKFLAAGGSKGYRWMEAEVVLEVPNYQEAIDWSYYHAMATDAIEDMRQLGDVEWFLESDQVMCLNKTVNANIPF